VVALAFVALLVGASGVTEAGLVYGVKNSASSTQANLFSFSGSVSGYQDLGVITLANQNILVDGLAQYSSSSPIFGFRVDGTSSTLIEIAPGGPSGPALATAVGSTLAGVNVRGAAFDSSGRLLVIVDESSNPAVPSNSLIRVDVATGVIVPGSILSLTIAGSLFSALTGNTDLAQRADGVFFLGNGSSLYALDINTGAVSLVGTDIADPSDALQPSLASLFGGLAFSYDTPSALFTADGNGQDDIFRFSTDPFSPASRSKLIGDIYPAYNAGLMDLAAPAAIPEPETFTLVLAALTVWGLVARRRQTEHA